MQINSTLKNYLGSRHFLVTTNNATVAGDMHMHI